MGSALHSVIPSPPTPCVGTFVYAGSFYEVASSQTVVYTSSLRAHFRFIAQIELWGLGVDMGVTSFLYMADIRFTCLLVPV